MTTVCAALSSWLRRNDRLVYYVRPVSLVNAAYRVMRQAYMSASANGALPANPRQIMYVARPEIFKISGKGVDDRYFTQTLLPDYNCATMSMAIRAG